MNLRPGHVDGWSGSGRSRRSAKDWSRCSWLRPIFGRGRSLLPVAFELRIEDLPLFDRQLALPNQAVNDLLALLHACGQCPDASQKHLVQSITDMQIRHDMPPSIHTPLKYQAYSNGCAPFHRQETSSHLRLQSSRIFQAEPCNTMAGRAVCALPRRAGDRLCPDPKAVCVSCRGQRQESQAPITVALMRQYGWPDQPGSPDAPVHFDSSGPRLPSSGRRCPGRTAFRPHS